MNIFVLDTNPVLAAKYHCDKHVSKMILESAQMLSTVAGGPYKPTHSFHPCTVWVGKSINNARWLVELARQLNYEYKLRYNSLTDHKSWKVIESLDLQGLPEKPMTPFAQAMPEELRIEHDPVRAYRNFYRTKQFAKWRLGAPVWWS